MRDFKLVFDTYRGTLEALEGVDFTVHSGECLGIVGETGCGKSATARALLGFIEHPGRVTGGEILFEDRDILKLSASELRRLRGNEISLIFQDAKKALNPTVLVGVQMMESARANRRVSRGDARKAAHRALLQVGLADPERIMSSHAFELSGGMAQRVMIAMAIVGEAKLIVADEPTSALDVSIQAQILTVMREARISTGSSLILITHDLGVAAENCDRVAVMYAGRVVEIGAVDEVFDRPAHPYTQRLIGALPKPGSDRLEAIPGTVPDLVNPPPGCRFANRCEKATAICYSNRPALTRFSPRHEAACHHPVNRCETDTACPEDLNANA